MKTLTITLFSLFLFLSNSTFSQLINTSPKAIANNVIVRMQIGEDPATINKFVPIHFEVEVEKILSQHSDIWLLKFNDANTTVDEVVEVIHKINTVLFAQPNREVELRAAPNDPNFGSQWHHDNIDSELAWDITTGGTTANGHDIVIALIESADLINHPDLKDNQWKNTAEIPGNGIDDDGNGYIDDYNGWNVSTNNDNIGTGSHGTSCAGMMGAKGNNSIGVSGINWDVKIMDIAGHNSPFTEANIIEAYNYALSARILWNQTSGASGAFVVATSASWGVDGGNPNNYPIWCSFYDDLGQAGILNVGATTNQNKNVDTYGDVPTGCASDYMIGVTATDQSDVIDFAGYGNQTINVAAPGSSVVTTAQNGGYTSTSGTSFACPLTAGLIGLMYSIPCNNLEALALNNPQSTADIVLQALYNGVDQSPHLIAKTISGGRINAKNSIDLLMAEVCSTCIPPSNIATTSITDFDASITFDADPNADSYIISIQVAGSGNWTDYTVTSTTYTFTGLTSCTEYEFKISSDCEGEIGPFSPSRSFRTADCGNCIELDYCETKALAPSVDFMVNSPSSIQGSYAYTPTTNFGGSVENGYNYGKLVLVDDGTASPNEGCNTLINASAINGNIAVVYRGVCNFANKALNAQNAGATAVIVVNNTGGTPTEIGGSNPNITIPAIMVSNSTGAILINSINNNESPSAILGRQNEWIESFEINGNTITTGDDNGYRLNDHPITLVRGQNYPFTLTPGYDGQALEEYTRIWLDLNQDGVFDSSELIYDQGSAVKGALSDVLSVPTLTTIGSTRMRVQMAYQGLANSTLPITCGNITFGEIEEFCVNIDLETGLNKDNSISTLKIYPNPSSTLLNIDRENNEIERVIIYTTNGQLVKEIQLENHSNSVNVSSWKPGVYFFKVLNGNGELVSTHRVSIIP